MKYTLAILLLFIISNPTFSQIVPPYVPTNGLIGWWPFNGNVGDSSGKQNHGTNNGATLTADRFGIPNKAYNFNGSSNRIDLPLNLNGNLINLTKYTFSGYVSLTSVNPQGNAVFSNWKAGPLTDPFGISLGFNPKFGASNCAGTGVGTQTSYNTNQWYHFVVVFDGTNSNAFTKMKIFINGVQIPTDTGSNVYSNFSIASSLGNTATHTAFGAWFSQFGWIGYYNGKLDDVGMWSRVLSQNEIWSLYTSTPCFDSITTQPISQVGAIGNSRNFSFSRSGTNINYQWQSNAVNLGWQNIPNSSQYSGANSNNLTINNLNVSNHNQLFRVVSGRTGCNADTSNIVRLTISNIAADSVRMSRLANDSVRLTQDSLNKMLRINKLIQDSSVLSARMIKLSNDSIYYVGRIFKLSSDSVYLMERVVKLSADSVFYTGKINKLMSDSIVYVGRINSLQNDSINNNITITNLNQEITTKNTTISLLQTDTTNKGNTIRSLQLALDNKHDTIYVASVITSDTLRITITTGLSVNSSIVNGISVYPNPATSILHLDLKNPGYYIATMTGVVGQSIITPTSGTIDISGLANGVYVLSIYDRDNKLVSTNKVMIMR